MSDVVIQVDHLWKKYRLGVLGTGTLRHDFNRWLHRIAGKPDPYAKVGEGQKSEDGASPSPLSPLLSPSSPLRDDEMWALRDISFEVKQGEILGIIGRNGAGKSTLLKILSRVTAPTSGEVRVKGRIASLLEVGTGFHPELTGRENIFLNGAILGMTKTEIKQKLDEIVAFAEIEQFIDTPVKRYSSGMYVRLAFAVAAHLDPEILIVDEVLAVGDAEFQRKCLGKIGEVAGAGRTVLFVSHNMAAMKTLCNRVILLKAGRIQIDGSAEHTVSHFLNERASSQYVAPDSKTGAPHVAKCWFSDQAGIAKESFRIGEPLAVNVELDNPNNESLKLEFAFFDSGGYKLWNFTHEYYKLGPITAGPKTTVRVTFFVPALQLHEVFVHIGLCLAGGHALRYLDHIREGLRCFVGANAGGAYRQAGTFIECPIKFEILSL